MTNTVVLTPDRVELLMFMVEAMINRSDPDNIDGLIEEIESGYLNFYTDQQVDNFLTEIQLGKELIYDPTNDFFCTE